METKVILHNNNLEKGNLENKRFESISIFYPFEKVEYREKKYDDGNFWYPYLLDIVDNRINRNILDVKPELGLSLNIFLSKQFDRYFDRPEIIAFLKEKISLYEEAFLIGLVYKEDRNGRIYYDMLPCFTETSKKNEEIGVTIKRLIEEECFSSWDAEEIACWYNEKFKKNITAVESNIDKNEINYYSKEEKREKNDDVTRKVGLYLWGFNIDKGINFLNKWRANQHNLETPSERKGMVDVCLVWIKDILDILDK